MAFIFTMRSTQSSGHRRDMHSTGTLPAISEDGTPFSIPPKLQQHPAATAGPPWSGMSLSRPFEHGLSRSPPSYSFKSPSLSEDDNEKVVNLREAKQIAKRGGWKRLALIAAFITLGLVGLIVGLVVGLRKKNSNSNSSTAGLSSNPTNVINTTFPAGSYGIETFLKSVNTSCTSNSATWRCYPYVTYPDSPSAAAARFDWLIQPQSYGSSTYTVSSTNNPFTLSFTNATLKLVDGGLATERYTFHIIMNKPVVPTTDITSSNAAATCYFNTTTLLAELYTRKENSVPNNNNATSSNSTSYISWPYAASIKQQAISGTNVPQCFNTDGNQLGGDFSVSTVGAECSCVYENYD